MNNEEVRQILDRYSKLGKLGEPGILEKIPLNERRYKCHTCVLIVDESPCPNCGERIHLEIACPLDHCGCIHPITASLADCPLCGGPVCPQCGSHDVVQVSRVTGYLADVAGFNAGKRQELRDRTRYTIE